jgi:hypothetical protein
MLRYHIFLLLAAALVSGCTDTSRTSPPTTTPTPPKTEADAGVIVTNLALQRGLRLQDYESPSVRFDTAKRVWWFNYQLKPPGMPGGHFTITVDENGKAQFFGGA